MSDLTLTRGFTAATARAASDGYRTLLGVVLIVEAAAGAALLVAPEGVSRLLAVTGGAWPRVAGLLLLIMVALLFAGRIDPVRMKLTNALGIVARGVLAVLLIAFLGRIAWVGAAEAVATIALGLSYFGYFKAEVMSRP
jgi:hypothetical protein